MRLLLVGGGNMGQALLSGWRRTIPDISVDIIEPFISAGLQKLCDETADGAAAFTLYASPDELRAAIANGAASAPYDAIILAIKPQNFPETLPQLAGFADGAFFLSIAAGRTLAGMAEMLEKSGGSCAIIRVMPNTPALIGEGMSVLVANSRVSDRQKQLAETMMRAVGRILWIADEEDMHAVTALSGSGPAYVFALIEAMQQAGEALGLAPDIAMQLARQTVTGSAMLAAARADISAAELRKQVTSPGGTTEAALEILQAGDESDLASLMMRALGAAARRSRELA